MHILIEEYQYPYEEVRKVLKGLDVLQDAKGRVSLSYVGYYFNPDSEVQDCVFILPKVLLEKVGGKELIFGHIDPLSIINIDKCNELKPEEYQFIYNLSVWIYRVISVFKEHEYDNRRGKKETDPSIVLHRQAPIMGRSKRRQSNTFLDVLLALQQWSKDNENFVMFTVKNIHSGYNKINWTRTIAHSHAIIQGGDPIYLNPMNKKKQVNFDEELLIIFFSILQYMRDTYGFPVKINVNFDLIRGERFKRYIDDYGKIRLKQIKYKYFSDKALELWELCYAFFDHPYRINMNIDQREYLLAKSFHVVFESIIDELLAGDQNLPSKLLDQEDGKRVDHMYQYKELTNNEKDEPIYYIGDSKYYKRGNRLVGDSIYKQFTYARNVIQWNIDLFNNGKPEEQSGHVNLRDDLTEGYNIIPNFFISASQDGLTASDNIHLSKDKEPYHLRWQFKNRLFDRDTFLLAHYDVNFLFIIALYGRNNQAAKVTWRNKVRAMFRKEIQDMLKEHFDFYAITAHADVNPEAYIKQNFQSVLGKIYHPFDDREGSSQKYFSLALRNPDKETNESDKQRILNENEAILHQLSQDFYVAECPLGVDPKTLPKDVMPDVDPQPRLIVQKQFLTMHHLENYQDTHILIGGYKGNKHLKWVFSRIGGKRDDAYNVRLGKDVSGGVVKSRDHIKHAKFVLLYEFGKENEGIQYAFRVKNTGVLTKAQMETTGYDNPQHDEYFCYFFDEEVHLGEFDVEGIIDFDKEQYKQETAKDKKLPIEYAEGRPIFVKGKELIKYRK